MFGQHIPGVVFEIFVIASLIRNRPATESLVNWFRPGWVQHHIANHTWTDDHARGYHRTHLRLTLAVAITQLLHLVAAAGVIVTMPVDVAKGLLGMLALVTNAIVLTTVLGGIGHFLRHYKSRSRQQR